jgi:HAMP domain-containing protein
MRQVTHLDIQFSRKPLPAQRKGETYQVALELPGLEGSPALHARLSLPREIHQQGRSSRRMMFLSVLAAGLLLGGLLVWLLDSLVLTRLSRLHAELTDRTRSMDFSKPLSSQGDDEIGQLTDSANGLVAAVHQALHSLEEHERSR